MNAENSRKYPFQSAAGKMPVTAQQCAEILPELAAYSIGAADPATAAQIESRLADCPDAVAELSRYQQLAERLLYSVPAAQPSAAVETRLRTLVASTTPSTDQAMDVAIRAQQPPQQNSGAPMRSPFLRRRAVTQRAPRTGNPALRTAIPAAQVRAFPFTGRRPIQQKGTKPPLRRQGAVPLPASMAMYQLDATETGNPYTSTVPAATAKATTRYPAASDRATYRSHPWHFGRFLATAATLALVFFNMALLVQNQQLQRQQFGLAETLTQQTQTLAQQNQALILLAAEEPQEVEIFSPDGTSTAKADILWNNQLGIAVVYVRDFPPCEAGMKYQLWLTKDGKRRSGGLFSVDSSGMGLLVVPLEQSIDLYDTIGITPEPDTGSPGPTAPPVVRSEL